MSLCPCGSADQKKSWSKKQTNKENQNLTNYAKVEVSEGAERWEFGIRAGCVLWLLKSWRCSLRCKPQPSSWLSTRPRPKRSAPGDGSEPAAPGREGSDTEGGGTRRGWESTSGPGRAGFGSSRDWRVSPRLRAKLKGCTAFLEARKLWVFVCAWCLLQWEIVTSAVQRQRVEGQQSCSKAPVPRRPQHKNWSRKGKLVLICCLLLHREAVLCMYQSATRTRWNKNPFHTSAAFLVIKSSFLSY